MADNKTLPNNASVKDFITKVEHKRRKQDAETLLDFMNEITGLQPVMWGDSIIGYGKYHYQYKSGHQGDYFLTGFSPRKTAMTIYIMPGFNKHEKQLKKLGKYKNSVSCLYITNLDNIDMNVLREIIEDSIKHMKEIYPDWSEDALV